MALTPKQKSKLPASAFVYPSTRKYPAPTKAQASKAGISEAQRQRTLRSARSFAGRNTTAGSPAKVNRVTAARSGGTLKRGGKQR